MILYNITMNIESQHNEEVMEWMKETYIPFLLKEGLVIENKILMLLNEEENNTGITYSFQFFLKTFRDLQNYQEKFDDIDKELYKKFKNKFVEFRTILEVIQ